MIMITLLVLVIRLAFYPKLMALIFLYLLIHTMILFYDSQLWFTSTLFFSSISFIFVHYNCDITVLAACIFVLTLFILLCNLTNSNFYKHQFFLMFLVMVVASNFNA